MSKSINKVILLGNVGSDPRIHTLPDGQMIANVSLATNRNWIDKKTQRPTSVTEWHRLIFFKRYAEIIAQLIKKGDKIYVEGSLRTNKWIDKAGIERITIEVVANELIKLNYDETIDMKTKETQNELYQDRDMPIDDIPI